MKKQFLILFAFISVLALSQVPQRFNKVIVTGDITSPKFIKTGSNADSVLLGNGSARSVNSLKIDTVNLSNRINAKATGNGTASGTNTGDETLTSIKTKLGAATSVSDGYLKYQDWSIFNSKEPAITKNTAFNKNFGTTTGTVLEGRTFGTAAGSSVGDFIQNQNSSAQSANMWISGDVSTNGAVNSSSSVTRANSGAFIPVKIFGNLNVSSKWYGSLIIGYGENTNQSTQIGWIYDTVTPSNSFFHVTPFGAQEGSAFKMTSSGEATFSSTVNSTGFLLNGNNLTSSLTTNYIPKWNGSNFVNATAGTDYQLPITLTTNGTSGAATFSGNVLNVPNYGNVATSGTYVPALTNYSNIASSSAFEAMYMHIGNMYSLSIKAAITPSASGSCILRITLPQQSNNKAGVFSVTSISNDQSTVLPSFTYTAGGADYVGVVVNVPSTDNVTLTVTGMYTHQ